MSMLDKNPYTEMLGIMRRVGGEGAPLSTGAVIGKVQSVTPKLKVTVKTKTGSLTLEPEDLKINAALKSGYKRTASFPAAEANGPITLTDNALKPGDELLLFPSLDGQIYYIACVLEGI